VWSGPVVPVVAETIVEDMLGPETTTIDVQRLHEQGGEFIQMPCGQVVPVVAEATLLWAMSEMMHNPQVLRKAQDEVRAAAGEGGKPRVEPDDVGRLTYLKMVVKETLRLHPPSTLMPRETIRDVRVCGYDVPAKTRVFVNLWAIGRDPASWAAAEEFEPERFEGSDIGYTGAHFELLPFGAGRRICPGLAMGEANVIFTLANLLYCFDWALPEGMAPEDVSMEEAGVLTFKPKTPLLVMPTRRH
jgi:4-hydroxyphenylacetaldehyde oxime monooxygenase